jgi:basic amino acid/polyamine antiporter, APA family
MYKAAENRQKTFSVFDSVAVVVGIVIGAGIFKLPTLVAMNVDSGNGLAVVWILGGFISLIGALCYAELSTAYPDAGGDYHFIDKAYGSKISFIFAWTRMMIIQPGSIVMMAFIVGDELARVLPFSSFSDSVYAFITVALLTGLNIAGVKNSNTAQKILTVLIIAGLAVIFVLGYFVSAPSVSASLQHSAGNEFTGKFGMAMVFVLLTFGGWNEAAYISSEIKNPKKNIARSLLAGISIVTVIYLLINLALFNSLGLEGMRKFDSYQQIVQKTIGGTFTPFIRILIVVAALSTTNVTIITGARSNFAFGRDFNLLKFLGKWNDKKGTPSSALIFQGIISFFLIVLGIFSKNGLESMVDYTAPAFWFFFLLAGVSLFILRYKDKESPRPFKVPLFPLTPLVFISFCIYMLHSSLVYTGIGAVVSVVVMITGAFAMIFDIKIKKRTSR